MVELIDRDIRVAIETSAALSTANDIAVNSMKGVEFYGAYCYNRLSNSIALSLAMSVAKLFELPTPRSKRSKADKLNKSDVSSIPLMVRLLAQKQCQRPLADRARGWTPELTQMEEHNAATCLNAINAAISAYEGFEASQSGRFAIKRVKIFRNKMLAHTLIVEVVESLPTYTDLFAMMDVASTVIEHANLAVTGVQRNYSEIKNIHLEFSKAFWEPALAAAANVGESTS
jgi:hypothetical protein